MFQVFDGTIFLISNISKIMKFKKSNEIKSTAIPCYACIFSQKTMEDHLSLISRMCVYCLTLNIFIFSSLFESVIICKGLNLICFK